MDPQELIAQLVGGYSSDYGSEPGDRFYLAPKGERHFSGRVPREATNPDAYERYRMLPHWSDLARQGQDVPRRGPDMNFPLTQEFYDAFTNAGRNRQEAIQKALEQQQMQEQDLEKVPMY